MTYRRLSPSYLSLLVAPVAGILLLSAPLTGQVKSSPVRAAAKIWTQPRTPDGQPDIQGIWTNSTLTPLQRPPDLAAKQFLTEAEAKERERRILQQADGDRRDGSAQQDVDRAYNQLFYDRGTQFARLDGQIPTSLIIDPPDGRIPPLTPEAQKREAARREARSQRGPADSWTDRNLAERCLSRGAVKLPGGYNNNTQIVQTRDSIMLMQEMLHEVRVIHLDGRPHLPPTTRLWLGDSIGHWEGQTLVVDTTNYRDDVRFASFNCCGPAGEGLHIVERFRRVDENTIDYRYTVNDSSTFTRPWTVAVPMTKMNEPLYEYACHEGNYAMEDMLKGARAEEAAAKK
ncbi:MAG TPA: hypothetical protein VEV17_08065 [Bryobacteraceae bacterium]|nr:hypothetical protein [Bryobacteraceae bacterium]